MPIARDVSGRTTYVSAAEFYRERPQDFFRSDPAEFNRRVTRARSRVLEVIRFASVPLSGRGMCHEVRMDPSVGSFTEQLTNYVDRFDGRRVQQVRRQRKQEANSGLAPHQRRLRSPQDIKRRRSALFGGKDIPPGYFGKRKPSQGEIDRFVDLMRWYLIEEAILVMYSQHELELINSTWYIPVSVMDAHRLPASGRSRVKYDDRSFHGRPNRDRALVAA
jgi:hypothetical protein